MPKKADLSLNERNFILLALHDRTRLDGRGLHEYRNVDLSFGSEYGHAFVALGKTQVACLISADITTPLPDRKFEGVFNISVEFSPMASPTVETGRPSTEEAVLARVLEKTVRRSSALDTESLCLVAGAKCFVIRADIHVLVNDGNVTDAACVALLASLQHFRRPEAIIQGDSVRLWDIHEREPVKLSLLHLPYCVSFGIYESGDVFLADTNAAEEEAREGEFTISMNSYGEVCHIAKHGGASITAHSILSWAQLALVRVQAISELVRQSLTEDERKRTNDGLMEELRAENQR